MRLIGLVLALSLAAGTGACSRDREEGRANARIEAARDQDDGFQHAFRRVAGERQATAEAGDVVVERTEDDAVRAYRKTTRVAGEGGMKADDRALVAALRTRLALDAQITGIDIDVDGGRVSLAGRVRSQDAAADAVRITLGTRGVREVTSRLEWSQR